MAQTAQTFLQLPMQMGGLRFGPFTSTVNIGSDPQTNQIVLDAGHGIYPAHATLHDMDDGTYSLAPAQPACQVFLIPAGQQQPWPVRSPVQAKPGDMAVFGTPQGPRFEIQRKEHLKKSASQIAAEARERGGEAGFVQGANALLDNTFGPSRRGGVGGEMERVAKARLMTKSPFREIYGIYTRVRTGALTNPRYIVAALMVVGTAIMGGTASCGGVAAALYRALMY
jgi:hypothetical protein